MLSFRAGHRKEGEEASRGMFVLPKLDKYAPYAVGGEAQDNLGGLLDVISFIDSVGSLTHST